MATRKRRKPSQSSGRKRKGGAPRRSLLRRLIRGGLIGVLLLLGLPVVQVGCVRYIDPPATPLMLQRKVAAWQDKDKHAAPIRYRWLAIEDVPEMFLRCVIVSEDARFFTHRGVDWRELKIAFAEAKKSGNAPRGASTITMQCARSLFLWQGRSWLRKGLEAYYTVVMETILSKKRILELYVNVIEMGDGVYGVGAAAPYYFDRNVGRLSRHELAVLAGVLPFPLGWDPAQPSPKLRARQRKILRREPAHRFPVGW